MSTSKQPPTANLYHCIHNNSIYEISSLSKLLELESPDELAEIFNRHMEGMINLVNEENQEFLSQIKDLHFFLKLLRDSFKGVELIKKFE